MTSSTTARFERLSTAMGSLGDALAEAMPSLAETDDDALGGGAAKGGGITLAVAEGAIDDSFGGFGDEETRAFYEDLSDVLDLVPAVHLGLSDEQVGGGDGVIVMSPIPANASHP